MNFCSFIAVVCSLVVLANGQSCPAGTYQHTIQPGESFWSMTGGNAACTCELLTTMYPYLDPCALQAGWIICIPYASSCPSSTATCNMNRCGAIASSTGTISYTSGAYYAPSGYTSGYGGTGTYSPYYSSSYPYSYTGGYQTTYATGYYGNGYYACSSGCSNACTIQSGGLIWNMARGDQNCINQIEACNNNVNPTTLQIGNTLCLPACASCNTQTSYGK